MSQSNTNRIAKNTLMLYIRMLLTMGVSLFTVRVVLDILGEVDYGIYNVVAGVVTMFSFLSGTMASASQRFLAFEIGRNNFSQLKKTFSMTMTIYAIIAVVILLLAETVGLWFLKTQMTIPENRMEASIWVYQFAILSFMMTMFTIPYNAAIIAHERMKVYAYVSIIEVSLKLLIVYLLVVFSFDKLKLYAILMFGVTSLITLTYRLYCINNFKECKLKFYWDTELFKEITSYSGWNLFGALSSVFKNQGINIILNLFFTPVVNAARGIAHQVNTAVMSFSNNFYTAVRPQIIKSYAANEHTSLMRLVFQSTKLSYYLLFFLTFPVLIETNYILGLWLKEIPDHTIIFLRLALIDMLLESLAQPIATLAQATGKIKWYQIIVGGTRILTLPISYIFLKIGYPPETVFFVMISITILCLVERLLIVKKLVDLKITSYLKKVVLIIALVSLSSILTLVLLQQIINIQNHLIKISFALFFAAISIYTIGLSKKEKTFLLEIIMNKLSLKRKKI